MTVSSGLPPLADGVTLCELGVDNLRSLRMEQPVELRRLTLLAGRNGIGKSTFARVFPLLRQSAGGRRREPLVWWERDEVDFGSFNEALRRGAEDMTFTFGFQTEGRRRRTTSTLCRGPDGSRVRRMTVEEGQQAFSLTFDDEGRLAAMVGRDHDTAFEIQGEDLPEVIRAAHGELIAGPDDDDRSVLRRYLDLRSAEEVDNIELLLYWGINRFDETREMLHELAERTSYLGPFRATPERSYRPWKPAFDRGLDPRGADLAMFLAALSEDERNDLNADLHSKFGFGVGIQSAGGHYSVHVALTDDTYNLMDVGYGYSQVLPVAVQLWASRRTLSTSREREPHAAIVIEQPELHLHPYQQVLMAQALGAFAADEHGPMQIIETHSDHLIGEIGMMIALGKLPPERVGVLCFEPHPEGGTRVFNAHFNEDGVLHDWPVGFLSP